MAKLSINDEDTLIRFFEKYANGVINQVETNIDSKTSYTYNGNVVYHYTLHKGTNTVFYAHDNAGNAHLLGIGKHNGINNNNKCNIYKLERGYIFGGRTEDDVTIGGEKTEWKDNKF